MNPVYLYVYIIATVIVHYVYDTASTEWCPSVLNRV